MQQDSRRVALRTNVPVVVARCATARYIERRAIVAVIGWSPLRFRAEKQRHVEDLGKTARTGEQAAGEAPLLGSLRR
uniref:Transcriptional regulator n=1 Tax=Ascaris lumbricoides TaxID=6252 RepID=A0A0M3HY25_ASCLU